MIALPQSPTAECATPESLRALLKKTQTVLFVSDSGGQFCHCRDFQDATIYTLSSTQNIDLEMRKHPSITRLDLLWIKCSGSPLAVIQSASEALRMTRVLVVEFGSVAFNGQGQLDASGHGQMYRVVQMARGYSTIGYSPDGTLVLQNIRAAIGRNVNRGAIPKPEQVRASLPPPVQEVKAVQEMPSKPATQRPAITMERLGTFGQWGKQVIQYAFIRSYANQHGIDYAVAKWVGQYLFGFQDKQPAQHMTPVLEETASGHDAVWGQKIPPKSKEFINHDFIGWAQFNSKYYLPNRKFIQSLYEKPADPQASRVNLALNKLRKKGSTIIGLHLRRGDSGRTIYPLTPIVWCLRWLNENWNRLQNPVLYIASEDISVKKYFSGYDAVTAEDLGIHHLSTPYPGYLPYFEVKPDRARAIDFFPDWFILQHSDVVLASNSTFSMSAAWVSTTVKETWRPKLSILGFEKVDPWNMEDFVNREHLDDYPGIPGTQLDDNPGYGWMSFKPMFSSVPEDPDEIEHWKDPPENQEQVS